MFQQVRYFVIAIANLDEAIHQYERLFGLQVMTPPEEQQWGFRSVMLGNGKVSLIELVQPSDPNSALSRFMKERAIPSNPDGEGSYLVSIGVDEIDKSVQHIRDQGGRVTRDDQSPDMTWVHPTTSNFAFIELSQTPS